MLAAAERHKMSRAGLLPDGFRLSGRFQKHQLKQNHHRAILQLLLCQPGASSWANGVPAASQRVQAFCSLLVVACSQAGCAAGCRTAEEFMLLQMGDCIKGNGAWVTGTGMGWRLSLMEAGLQELGLVELDMGLE